jgi:hypothetical protein
MIKYYTYMMYSYIWMAQILYLIVAPVNSVLKTEPDRPVGPVRPGTGVSLIRFAYWIGHANEPAQTGITNRPNPL